MRGGRAASGYSRPYRAACDYVVVMVAHAPTRARSSTPSRRLAKETVMNEIKNNAKNNDRLVMYIAIPKSLKMGIGKVGATCGHAAQLLMQSFEARKPSPSSVGWSSPACDFERLHEEDMKALAAFHDWLASDYGKIVLGASDEEFAEVRRLPNIVTVVDIGLKQVAPGSVTAVGLWPMLKSVAPDIIKKLEPLR